MKFNYLKLHALFICGSIAVANVSCKEDKKEIKKVEVSFKKEGTLLLTKAKSDSIIVTFDIEIADSDYEVQTGLMYRSSMKKNQGMLFIFPNVEQHAFYMKNTQIPLDILFIDEKKAIVKFYENAQPFNETSLPSKFPIKYVLELNAGMIKEFGIDIGDQISF